jgi:hypothetical protein
MFHQGLAFGPLERHFRLRCLSGDHMQQRHLRPLEIGNLDQRLEHLLR